MKSGRYIPEKGDIVWLEFNPQSGHEQSGRRPAVIISPKGYNQKTGLALLCPITSKIKNYPFEVIIYTQKIKGAILADQVKSIDWQEMKAEFIASADKSVIEEVRDKIKVLID